MTSTTVLITGANRGIGKGLVANYLAAPNTTVIATVRDPSHPTSESLSTLPKASGSSLITIKLDVSSADSINSAIQTLQSTHNIRALDVVVANAGISYLTSKLTEVPISEIQNYIDVNAYGALNTFKAVLPLLRASKAESKGKFALISSLGGSITQMVTVLPLAPYGASKALANFLIKWLALENEDVLIWSMHPGLVATDMGQPSFDYLKELKFDVSPYEVKIEDSTKGIKNVIDGATKETAHGKFLSYDGTELPW